MTVILFSSSHLKADEGKAMGYIVEYEEMHVPFTGDFIVPKDMYIFEDRKYLKPDERFNLGVFHYKNDWNIDKIQNSNELSFFTMSSNPEYFNDIYKGVVTAVGKLGDNPRTQELKYLLKNKNDVVFIFSATPPLFYPRFYDQTLGITGRKPFKRQRFFFSGVVSAKNHDYFVYLRTTFTNKIYPAEKED